MNVKPILEFSTLEPARPVVRIDGELYDLAVLSDFGPRERSRIARLLGEATELERVVDELPAPEPTGKADVDRAIAALGSIPPDVGDRLVALLDEILELILRAPAEVRAKLNDGQKSAIAAAFTPALRSMTPQAEAV